MFDVLIVHPVYLFKQQVRAYEKIQQARYEAKIQRKDRQ